MDSSSVTGDNWQEWLDEQVEKFGETLLIEPIPKDDHTSKDPVEEAIELVGSDKVIVVKEEK